MRHSGVAVCGKSACTVAKRGSELATVSSYRKVVPSKLHFWGLGGRLGLVSLGFPGFGRGNPFFLLKSLAFLRRDRASAVGIF